MKVSEIFVIREMWGTKKTKNHTYLSRETFRVGLNHLRKHSLRFDEQSLEIYRFQVEDGTHLATIKANDALSAELQLELGMFQNDPVALNLKLLDRADRHPPRTQVQALPPNQRLQPVEVRMNEYTERIVRLAALILQEALRDGYEGCTLRELIMELSDAVEEQ